jgi:hypothetical protein
MKQIQQLNQVLNRILTQVLKLKKSNSPIEVMSFTNEKIKETFDMDIEELSILLNSRGIFFLYDPIMVSLFGGTIGHLVIRLRVKQYKYETKNLFFVLAFFRFLVKIFLGWLSFLTVSGNKEKRAIHDILPGSIVIQN